MSKVSVIVQARFGSSRLPGKVLKSLCDKTVMEHVIERLNRCKSLDNIIIATTTNTEDDPIADYCSDNNILCYRGSEDNVLNRYYQAALISNTDVIVRITCDCPLVDPNIVDDMIHNFLNLKLKEGVHYYQMKYYNGNQGFPDGFDCEMFIFKALQDAFKNATLSEEKEHVSPYISKNYNTELYKIKLEKKYKNLDLNTLHLSLDNEEDYKVLQNIFNNVYSANKLFTIYDVLDYLNDNPDVLQNNEEIDVFRGKGQKLYKEAKKLIPGGTQLLSKRPEMFLPEYWPSYYQKATGIEVVTIDGVKMKDFSYMGVGACILGYKDPDVNREVHRAVDRGNMCTLNCPSEVELTKLFLELHPWAGMARYTRASGEACNMAVRIGRAASKKDKVAFCGYHGWHDWYLASNWNNGDDLKEHLLSGLSAVGVPKVLKDTAFPFNYNKIEELIAIIKDHDIGCVIMEPQRSEPPSDNFLQKVRELCDKHNIILIFDEVSAAFRINSGGLHLLHGVNPDMAVFGKSIGNGYPIGAVIGTKECMNAAQSTFISSTFFTEDIGFTAAIATITKHRNCDVGNHIKKQGEYFQKKLREIGTETGIKITVSGLPAFSAWSFDYDNGIAVKTLYVQKMLERKILAKNAFYLSYAHKKEDIDFYLENLREVFKELSELIKNGEIESNLLGPTAHTGFKRLA
jgi:glutamate-1-semialdehyde aminotransferase/spore coat polysaccharide biosynthesis protein SpsF (cytidylyltransferase family)